MSKIRFRQPISISSDLPEILRYDGYQSCLMENSSFLGTKIAYRMGSVLRKTAPSRINEYQKIASPNHHHAKLHP